jgi:hypothetical protein
VLEVDEEVEVSVMLIILFDAAGIIGGGLSFNGSF